MNLNYTGRTEESNSRHALLGNVKDKEYDIVTDYLTKENFKWDGFGGMENGTNDIYVEVEDREEFEDFKQVEYKEIKKALRK